MRTVGCTQAKSKRAKLGQRRCGQVGWRWQVVFLGLDGMSMLGQRGFWSGLEPPVNCPLGKPQISRTAGLSHWADITVSDHSQRRELGARASQGRVGCSLGRYIDAVSSEASHDEVEVDFFTKKCCRDIICSLENPRLFRIALMRRCSTRRVPRP